MFGTFKNSLMAKVLSVFLVFTFATYNTSFGAVSKDVVASVQDELAAGPLSVEDIGIAIDTGTIKSKHQAAGQKVIVHIQDAHCNFEAQQNINKILDQLKNECGLDMISVEGAEGIVDTSWFKAFPDAEIRKEVATYFMKKGEITGAEFFSITSDYSGTIYGAETRDYYIKNLKAFTKTYPHKTLIENYLTDTRTIANRIKAIIYPENLKDLDLKIRAFDDKEIELSDFASYLNKVILKEKLQLRDYPNFKKLVDTLEYETKIDFDIVDQERSQYIDLLSKKMDKKEMAELVTYSIRFKKGHIKPVKFYSFLRDKAEEKKIAIIQEYPNLFYYYIYTKLYDGIDNEFLFKEIDAIEKELKNRFFQTDDQRKLDQYAQLIDMYLNLVDIELTNDDYDLFKSWTKDITLDDIVGFLGVFGDRYNLNYTADVVPVQISQNLPNMVEFYEVAMKRDKALIDNTLKEMDEEGKDISVLIAGGFHTRGMMKMLEKAGVSYVVVMPKITKDVETPYIKVLTNQRTSLEDIITEHAMPGTGPAAPQAADKPSVSELLAPLLRSYGAQMLFDDEDGGKMLAELTSLLGNDDYAQAVTAFESGFNDRYVRTWLGSTERKLAEKVYLPGLQAAERKEGKKTGVPPVQAAKNAAHDRIVKFATDADLRDMFVDHFINNAENHFQELNGTPEIFPQVRDDLVVALNRALDETYGTVASQQAPQATDTGNGRPSTGADSVSAGSAPLTEPRRDLYDAMLARRFQHTPEKVKEDTDVWGRLIDRDLAKSKVLKIQVHEGLEEDIISYNDHVLYENGEGGTIPFSRVHPSTYTTRVLGEEHDQLHVSKYVWDKIGEEVNGDELKAKVINHELAHILIFKGQYLDFIDETRIFDLWKIYLAFNKDKGFLSNAEDFVDKVISDRSRTRVIVRWAQNQPEFNYIFHNAELAEKLRNFQPWDSDTTDLRGKIGRWQTERIVGSVDLNDPVSIRKALSEAYALAAEDGYTEALETILNMLAGNGSDKARRGIIELAKVYPLWIKADLWEGVKPATRAFMLDLFNDSPANEEVSEKNVVALIMAGGGGERMFPESTKLDPKQLAHIVEEGLITKAVRRVYGHLGAGNVYVQTIPALKEPILKQLEEAGCPIPAENVFTEPKAADTAGAIGYAAAKFKQIGRGDDAMFVCTADHYIDTSDGEFRNAYMAAAKAAIRTSSIGTFGIKIRHRSEEYGCIEVGAPTAYEKEGIVVAKSFREKPKGADADRVYAERDRWTFNSGMFVGRPDTWLKAFRQVAPVYGQAFDAIAEAKGTDEEVRKVEEYIFDILADFKKTKSFPHSGEPTGRRDGVSIDFVLAQALTARETSEVGLFMVPGNFEWIDIGSYKSAYEYFLTGKVENEDALEDHPYYTDAGDNVVVGVSEDDSNVTLTDCSGCLVYADSDIEMDLSGLKDVVIVYNPTIKTVMVAPRDGEGASIKGLLAKINDDSREDHNGALRGYAIGDTTRNYRGAREGVVVTADDDAQTVVAETLSGDGIVQNSQVVYSMVESGLGVVLDMKEEDGNGLLYEQRAQGQDSLQIRLARRPKRVVLDKEAEARSGYVATTGISSDLTAKERINDMIDILLRKDIPLNSLDAEVYRKIYSNCGISMDDASEEVSKVKSMVTPEVIDAYGKAMIIFDAEARKAAAPTDTPAQIEKSKIKALGFLRQWMTDPMFQEYRKAIFALADASMTDAGVAKEFYDSFWRVIPFGTGGRRWRVGIGPNRMNAYMAAMTAQGHVRYLQEQYAEDVAAQGDVVATPNSVIGAWDVRAFKKFWAETPSLEKYRKILERTCPAVAGISSEDLSKVVALVYAGNNIRYIHPTEMRSTPWLSYLVNNRPDIVGGIVLSSSHNPFDNNGTKFYEKSGAQAPPHIVQKLMNLGDKVSEINFPEGIGELLYSQGLETAYQAARDADGSLIKELSGTELRKADEEYMDSAIDQIKSMYTDVEWSALLPYISRTILSFNAMNGTGWTGLGNLLKDRMRERFGLAFQVLKHDGDVPDSQFPTTGGTGVPNPEAEKSFNPAMEIGVTRTLDWAFGEGSAITKIKGVVDEDAKPNPETGEYPFVLLSALEHENGQPFTSSGELKDYYMRTRGKYIRGVVFETNDDNETPIREFNERNNMLLSTDPDADRVGIGLLRAVRAGDDLMLNWVSANDNDESGILLFRYRMEKLLKMAKDGRLLAYLKEKQAKINEIREREGKKKQTEDNAFELVMVNTVVSNDLSQSIAQDIGAQINTVIEEQRKAAEASGEAFEDYSVKIKSVVHSVGFKFTGEVIDIINSGEYIPESIVARTMQKAEGGAVDLDNAVFVMSSEEGEGSLIGFEGSVDKDSAVTGLGLAVLSAEAMSGAFEDAENDKDPDTGQARRVRTPYEYLQQTYRKYGYAKMYLEPCVMTGEYGFKMINDSVMTHFREDVMPRVQAGEDVVFGGRFKLVSEFTDGSGVTYRSKDHYDLLRPTEEEEQAAAAEGRELTYGRDVSTWDQAIRESLNILEFVAEDINNPGALIILTLRPSGTEPKQKNYSYVKSPVKDGVAVYSQAQIDQINRDAIDELMIATYLASGAQYPSAIEERPGLVKVTELDQKGVGDLVDEETGNVVKKGLFSDMRQLLTIFPIIVSVEAKLAIYFPMRDWLRDEARSMAGMSQDQFIAKYNELRPKIEKYLVNFKKEDGVKFVEEAIKMELRRQIRLNPDADTLAAVRIQALLWFGPQFEYSRFEDIRKLEVAEGTIPADLDAQIPDVTAEIEGQQEGQKTDEEGDLYISDPTGRQSVGSFSIAVAKQDSIISKALEVLGNDIQAGKPIKLLPDIRTGLHNYTWGEAFASSYIMGTLGDDADRVKELIMTTLGIQDEARFNTTQIAERWIGSGNVKVEVDGQVVILPREVLLIWGKDVYGSAHMANKGAETGVTAKILTAQKPLSVQFHNFSEMFIPLEVPEVAPGEERPYVFMDLDRNFVSADGTPEVDGFMEALRQRDTSMLKKVYYEAGVPVIVPPGVLHAYVGTDDKRFRIWEIKGVNASGDKAGTYSFVDSLRYMEHPNILALISGIAAESANDNERIHRLTGTMPIPETLLNLLTLDDMRFLRTAGAVQEQGDDYLALLRLNKDLLTMAKVISASGEPEVYAEDKARIAAIKKALIDNNPQALAAEGRDFTETITQLDEFFYMLGHPDDKFMAGEYHLERAMDEDVYPDGFVPSFKGNDVFPGVLDRVHTLYISAGEVDIEAPNGDITNLKAGEEVIMPATATGYRLRSVTPTANVFVQYLYDYDATEATRDTSRKLEDSIYKTQLPIVVEPEAADEAAKKQPEVKEEPAFTTSVAFTEAGAGVDASRVIEIRTSDPAQAPSILGNSKNLATDLAGRIVTITTNKTVLVVGVDPATGEAVKDEKLTFRSFAIVKGNKIETDNGEIVMEEGLEYRLVNPVDEAEGYPTVTIDYDKTPGEKLSYTVFAKFIKNIDEFLTRGTILEKPIDLLFAEQALESSELADPDRPGLAAQLLESTLNALIIERAEEKGVLDKFTKAVKKMRGEKLINVVTYNGRDIADLGDKLASKRMRANAITIFGATHEIKKQADENTDMKTELEQALSGRPNLRVLPFPSLGEIETNKGFEFILDMAGTAIMQSQLSRQAIMENAVVAQDFQTIMSQMMKTRSLKDYELFYFLSQGELGEMDWEADDMTERFTPDALGQLMENTEEITKWIGYMLDKIRPLVIEKLKEDFKQIKKVMWSV